MCAICIDGYFGSSSPSLVAYSSSLSFSPLFLLCFSRIFRLLARWRPGIRDRRECVSIAGRFGLLIFHHLWCYVALAYLSFYTVASECKRFAFQAWCQPFGALWLWVGGFHSFIYFLVCVLVPLFYCDLHPPAGVWVCFGVSRDLGLSRMQLMWMDFRWQGAL